MLIVDLSRQKIIVSVSSVKEMMAICRPFFDEWANVVNMKCQMGNEIGYSKRTSLFYTVFIVIYSVHI